MAPLREVLRRPDRRTWRRFVPSSGGAHRRPPTPAAPADPWLLDGVEHADDVGRRPQAWQVVAGVLILAAGIVLATGLWPTEPTAPPSDERSGHDVPTDHAAAPQEAPAATTATTGIRLWPAPRVEVHGRVVRTDAGRWEVGREGDLVTVGDWDCDRLPTPAVLRPSDGRVAVFDGWAPPDTDETARTVATVAGAATLEAGRTCGELVVRTASGGTEVLDTRSATEGVAR